MKNLFPTLKIAGAHSPPFRPLTPEEDAEEIKMINSTGAPKETITSLAKALERLYLDRDLGSRMGKAARERAAQNYHWDKLGDRINEIYQTALDVQGND